MLDICEPDSLLFIMTIVIAFYFLLLSFRRFCSLSKFSMK